MLLHILRKRHFLRLRSRQHRRRLRGIGAERQHALADEEDIAVLLSVERKVLVAESDVVVPLKVLSDRLRVVDRGNGLVERDALLLGKSDADLNGRELESHRKLKKIIPSWALR